MSRASRIGPKDTAFNYKTFSCIPLKGHWDHRRSAFMVGILLDGVAAQVIHRDVTIFKRVPFLLGRSLGGSPSTGCRYRVPPIALPLSRTFARLCRDWRTG